MSIETESEVGQPDGPVDAETTTTVSAPYMAFQGLRNLLDRIQRDGVPQVFDKSFFGNQSGSLTAQIRGTLRFFDLIDEDKQPTQLLRELVSAEEAGRIEMLRTLAETKYADAIRLGEENGTQGQLAEVFRNRGLTGATVQKAISFYLGLAEYIGLPTSTYFRRGRVTSSNPGNGGSKRTTRKRKDASSQKPPSQPPASPPGTTVEAKKLAYIEMLMKLVESGAGDGGVVQADLLDRIERALGYPDADASKKGGDQKLP